MTKKVAPTTPNSASPSKDKSEQQEQQEKLPVIVSAGLKIRERINIVSFRGRAMVEAEQLLPNGESFYQFVPLHKDNFERLAYPILGGVSRSRIADVFAYVINTAPDLTPFDHLISFGDMIWDSRELTLITDPSDEELDQCIWRSPYIPVKATGEPHPFVLSLAGGDEAHYEDIMQSIAPVILSHKPDGVVWWVGSGANGKSSLMDALYRIFPNQLASLTVKRLVDGRDTPSLNGNLANIVKESSEGRIDDTQIYKSIGTHEDFRVHKFHSQDDLLIRGNVHHIFSANQIPIFNDKGYSARRRTYIVPFNEQFESDPDFNNRTFTPEALGLLITEIIRYALKLHEQQLRYKFSAVTLAAKLEYDAEANNAEEYAKDIINDGVVAFESFAPVKVDYENWCARMGHVPLGLGNLRRALQQHGFSRTSTREDGSIGKQYRLKTVEANMLIPIGMSRPGLYTSPGFTNDAIQPLPDVEPTQTDMLEEW